MVLVVTTISYRINDSNKLWQKCDKHSYTMFIVGNFLSIGWCWFYCLVSMIFLHGIDASRSSSTISTSSWCIRNGCSRNNHDRLFGIIQQDHDSVCKRQQPIDSCILHVRGGSTEEGEDEEEEEEEAEQDDNNDEEDEESEGDAVDGDNDNKKLNNKHNRNVQQSQNKNDDAKSVTVLNNDFGRILSELYNVPATREKWIQKKINKKKLDSDNILPIIGGSFTDALQLARSKGRLLLILVPVSKQSTGKSTLSSSNTVDQVAVESFLSADVTKLAESMIGKKKQQQQQQQSSDVTIDQKSFVLWSTTANSPDASAVLKRVNGIQAKNPKTGTKRPLLAVLYPGRSSSPTTTIVPQLIAQHHCSPPPNSETMVAWLQSIRKRSAVYYKRMFTELIENEYHQQRVQGYKGSIDTDIQRKRQALIEEKERKHREEQQRLHKEKILKRRQQLKETLIPEPQATTTTTTTTPTTTVALRFADGTISDSSKPGKRRFLSNEATLADLFNWIDVEYEVEREHVVLRSMKSGGCDYRWIEENNKDDDSDKDTTSTMSKTLSELGFGKMIALRVSIVQPTDERK